MRVCFLGDSFVNGTGDPDCLGWAGRLCAQARRAGRDLTYYNLGIRRDTSADLLRRWRQEAAERFPPDADGRLIFSFGVNDCLHDDGRQRVTPTASLANAETMLGQASRWKPTLMVGPPPIADREVNVRIAQLSQSLRALCDRLAVPYLETFPHLAANPVWMRETAAHDGAHPGTEGYARFADFVGQWPAWLAWVS